MTRTSAVIVLILAAATLFLPLSTFAYRGGDPGISVMSLADRNNNNNHLAACTNKSSQQTEAVPSFCNGNLVVIKHVINDDGGTSSARDFTISVARSFPGEESAQEAEEKKMVVARTAKISEYLQLGYTDEQIAMRLKIHPFAIQNERLLIEREEKEMDPKFPGWKRKSGGYVCLTPGLPTRI